MEETNEEEVIDGVCQCQCHFIGEKGCTDYCHLNCKDKD